MVSIPELHRLISLGLKQGIVKASQWGRSSEKIEGYNRNSLYNAVRGVVINGRGFAGHGNWYGYISKEHGVAKPQGAKFVGKPTRSTEELKELIRKTIEKTYEEGTPEVSASDWRGNTRVVLGRTLSALFQKASRWKVGGKGFGGHGRWHVFLEKELGITPVHHPLWSDERFHRTIALLAEQHPPGQVTWKFSQKPVLHGRSLQTLYVTANTGNKAGLKAGEKKNPWFGHGSFKKYVEWTKLNYGTGSKYGKKTWREEHG